MIGGGCLDPDATFTWLPPVILAPFIGSFLGVLIRRLPARRPLALSRSACESCGHALTPLDMIPIASFAACRGRCRYCGARIAPMHLTVELAALAVALLACALVGDPAALWWGCAFGWTLLVLAWIDWRHVILPDLLTLPLVLAGLAATAALEPAAIFDHALAAAVGYTAFRLIALIYRAVRKREGLGQGDAKLMAAAGAWTGLSAMPVVLLGAATGTLLWALAMRLRGAPVGVLTRLPLGPALAAASWIVWLHAFACP